MRFDEIRYLGFFKTIYINLKCCKWKDAIKLPIVISRNTCVVSCKSNCFEFIGGGKTGLVSIGFNRENNKGLCCSLKINGKIIVRGNRVHSFGAGCSIDVGKGAILDIGNNFICTGDSYITVRKSIVIGNNNLWSYNEVIMDSDQHYIYDEHGNHINRPNPICFGDNIWMGCNCLILKGSKIPSNTIVAAGSIITKVLSEENTIVTSHGKIIKQRVSWNQRKRKN